jgi:hypothetical protein
VCHPYSDDPINNALSVLEICKELKETYILQSPQIFLGMYIDEEHQRDLAMDICLHLVSRCDYLVIFGNYISKGMHDEIQLAHRLGIPVLRGKHELEERTTGKDSPRPCEVRVPSKCVHPEGPSGSTEHPG